MYMLELKIAGTEPKFIHLFYFCFVEISLLSLYSTITRKASFTDLF